VDAHDIRFMEHALGLARKSIGLASPNPHVGCMIVRDSEIVGEGFHQYEWRDHAEIVALKFAGERARGATLYVNLEPCNHIGRTGPCTEAIIAAGVRRVVAAMQDPNPATSGRGFERLHAANIETVCGVLEDDARRLNEAFACWIRSKKPFVTLKSALTLDGQVALPGSQASLVGSILRKTRARGHPTWITSEESRAQVHRMRHASDALLTGIGTVNIDDPHLTDRSGLPRRRRMLRVVLDYGLAISLKSRVVRTCDDDLLILTGQSSISPKTRALEKLGVEVLQMRSRNRRIALETVMGELGRRDVLSVLLEAGPTLNGDALVTGVVHKLMLFYAPKIAGENRVPFAFAPRLRPSALHNVRLEQFGPDIAVEGYLQDVYRA
jgi:diaminohydroxyphosphoribosylaminopyrimidine deaminase / 5-amino-6-(5-phosphoribosylamino)uracil reductase